MSTPYTLTGGCVIRTAEIDQHTQNEGGGYTLLSAGGRFRWHVASIAIAEGILVALTRARGNASAWYTIEAIALNCTRRPSGGGRIGANVPILSACVRASSGGRHGLTPARLHADDRVKRLFDLGMSENCLAVAGEMPRPDEARPEGRNSRACAAPASRAHATIKEAT